MRNLEELTHKSIGKLLFKYTIPAIIGTMVVALYSVVDTILISQYFGSEASAPVAGMTLTMPMFNIVISLGILVASGTSALISIKLGEHKKEYAEKLLGNALGLLILIAIGNAAVGLIFMDPILKLFGATASTLPYARTYMTIIMIGLFFNYFAYGMNSLIRAEGSPKISMKVMLIGFVSNIILDPIFIFGLDMGIQGAAIATVLASMISSMFVFHYYLSDNSVLRFHVKNLKPDWKILKPALAIGLSPSLMSLTGSIVTVAMNHTLRNHGGDLAIGAMGIINGIAMFIFFPVTGITQGIQPILGYNYGAKDYDRVRQTVFKSAKLATLICLAGSLLIVTCSEPIISLYNTEDKALIDLTNHAICIVLSCIGAVGFQMVSTTLFQSIGKPKMAIFIFVLRQILLIPSLLLLLPHYWGLDGVWLVPPTSDILAGLVTFFLLKNQLKKLAK